MPLNSEQFESMLKNVIDSADLGYLHHAPSGMAVLLFPDGRIRVLGCPTCLAATRGQDAKGYPTLDGVTLKSAHESNIDTSHLSDEVRANLWMCPQCGSPQLHLLPTFSTSIGMSIGTQ